MAKSFPLLGFDIGGTKVAACLGDSDGNIITSRRIDNRERDPQQVLAEMVSTGKTLLAESGIDKNLLKAVGIGSPAPMDIPNGLILGPPNMKKWQNVAVRDYIAEQFQVPAYFDNDANAGALAEWFFGAGKGHENMLYLTMSTGIGGGIIANGHLLHGKSFLAGETGHIVLDVNGPLCNCGMKGCYEAFCGGRAIAQRLQRELADQPDHPIIKFAGGNLKDVDLLALEKAVRAGNSYAEKIWDEMCFRNAQAIGIFINTLNPGKIVLGTLAWAAGELFMEPLMKYLPQFCWPEMLEACEISVSALGREIGEYSGICVALNALYEQNEWQLPWSDILTRHPNPDSKHVRPQEI